MIDLHSHILPGLDDGPAIIEQSMAMCRMAAHDGIKTVVATPHFKPGIYDLVTTEEVYHAAGLLRARIAEEGLDLRIVTGAEVRMGPKIDGFIDQFEHLTINSAGAYMLAEFPMGELPGDWVETLDSLLARGITPIIAHPERCRGFLDNPVALFPMVKKGVLLQITAQCLTGEAGKEAQLMSDYLLKNELVHVIATDSHATDVRPPVLSRAAREASRIVGEEAARALVTTIPQAIIDGRRTSATD